MNSATLIDAILGAIEKQVDPYAVAALPPGFFAFKLPAEAPPMTVEQAKALRARLREKLAADPGFLAALGGAVEVVRSTLTGLLAA